MGIVTRREDNCSYSAEFGREPYLAMFLTQAGPSLSSTAQTDSSLPSWSAVKILQGPWSANHESNKNKLLKQKCCLFNINLTLNLIPSSFFCDSKFPHMIFATSKRGSLLHSAILFPPFSLQICQSPIHTVKHSK